MKSPVTE